MQVDLGNLLHVTLSGFSRTSMYTELLNFANQNRRNYFLDVPNKFASRSDDQKRRY